MHKKYESQNSLHFFSETVQFQIHYFIIIFLIFWYRISLKRFIFNIKRELISIVRIGLEELWITVSKNNDLHSCVIKSFTFNMLEIILIKFCCKEFASDFSTNYIKSIWLKIFLEYKYSNLFLYPYCCSRYK